ncbi:MAG: FAD-dependent oxidoreductase, partial [Acidobacteriota bacterium]
VVGAGATGVELAGAVAEVSKKTLDGEFRRVDPADARVLLVEGGERVLASFGEKLSAKAQRSIEARGVEVRLRTLVSAIDEREVELTRGDKKERLRVGTVLWAAGVEASPLGRMLGDQSRAEIDRQGRVVVESDCSVLGRPEVFAIGDLASFRHGLKQPLPGLAPVAMQQGRYLAKVFRKRLVKPDYRPEPFRYVDKGNMAVVGRRMAVADIKGLELAGGFAWLMWLFVHLMYLAEFQNRVLVLVQWGWNYLTRNRSARLITGELPTLAARLAEGPGKGPVTDP